MPFIMLGRATITLAKNKKNKNKVMVSGTLFIAWTKMDNGKVSV
jgi:hypothetical protein